MLLFICHLKTLCLLIEVFFEELANTLVNWDDSISLVMLGDLNARTGTVRDFMEEDLFIFSLMSTETKAY